MSVVLSCLYELGCSWLKWKLTVFICRSLYVELQPEEKVYIPDSSSSSSVAPIRMYMESKAHEHFTRFVVFMMWLDKNFTDREFRYHFRVLQRRYPESWPPLFSLYWQKVLLIFTRRYKKEVPSLIRHPSRDKDGYPLSGLDVCR